LRCICTLLRIPLPSINEYAPKMSTSIFGLLHRYAGSTAGENLEMVQTAFKVKITYSLALVFLRKIHKFRRSSSLRSFIAGKSGKLK
jgi:hypothetical protein